MFTGRLKHDAYLASRVNHWRSTQNLPPENYSVVFALNKEPGDSWRPMYAWLRDNRVVYYSWSPFANEFRCYIAFKHARDAMLLKMSWPIA